MSVMHQGAVEAASKLAPLQELAREVPTQKPEKQKSIAELEEDRLSLEVAVHAFAGKDGKGGEIAVMKELMSADEADERELIELLGDNPELQKELGARREDREKLGREIRSLEKAHQDLIKEIAVLNQQIAELKAAQVNEGKTEVEAEAKRQEEIPDLSEHAVLIEPPPIPEHVREASIKRYQERFPEQAAVAQPEKLEPAPQAQPEQTVSMPSSDSKAAAPVAEAPPTSEPPLEAPKPEPAAKNEAGPENMEEAKAFLGEDQREKMEVWKKLLVVYKTYTADVLPKIRDVADACKQLGGIGLQDAEGKATGPFSALQSYAELQLKDTQSLQPLFAHLQDEALLNKPQDIEARTRDVQLVTVRLKARMQGIERFRNTLLAMRGGVQGGSRQEAAFVAVDRALGGAWQGFGAMSAEWQPVGDKVTNRNGAEYHRKYKAAYDQLASARAAGKEVGDSIPDDVKAEMPKVFIPKDENLGAIKGEGIALDLASIKTEVEGRVKKPDQAAPETKSSAKEEEKPKAESGQERLSRDEAKRIVADAERRAGERRKILLELQAELVTLGEKAKDGTAAFELLAEDAERGPSNKHWQFWSGRKSRAQEAVIRATPFMRRAEEVLGGLQGQLRATTEVRGSALTRVNLHEEAQKQETALRLAQELIQTAAGINRELDQSADNPRFGLAFLHALEGMTQPSDELVDYLKRIRSVPADLENQGRGLVAEFQKLPPTLSDGEMAKIAEAYELLQTPEKPVQPNPEESVQRMAI